MLGGDFYYGRSIAKYLRAERPIYGIRLPGRKGEIHPFNSIEKMASEYLDSIGALFPQRPYALACWSWGIYPAYEMACQLAAQGNPPALLAVIDTVIPVRDQRRSLLSAVSGIPRFLANLPNWIRYDLVLYKPADISRRGKFFFKSFIKQFLKMTGINSSTSRAIKIEDLFEFDQKPEEIKLIMHRHWQLGFDYIPQPYPGRITLFQAQLQGLFSAFSPK
jgi:hypothetical protein